ncbi:MAG TPA: DUF3616 domain-containing protein [Candidatus Limnocylindria bacterium]|jgi:hypothetical protein|nr:DUF3616 domain-containing protein [Candidatus Limnocylindria bacterium]
MTIVKSVRPFLATTVGCLLAAWVTTCQAYEAPIIRHSGMAEASAAVPIGTNLVLIANDGDNRLRLFRADRPGGPLASYDLDAWYPPFGKNSEMDLEGAARITNRIFWIGSHSRNKEGKPRLNRHVFLATDLSSETAATPKLAPVGHPCRSLVEQWLGDPRTRELLGGDSPADPEDINIEGLSVRAEGGLFVGFRSPLAHEKAILVPLLNPDEILSGKKARFGDPATIDLDGQGIRDIAWTGREYYLIAGNSGGGGRSRLIRWAGPGHLPSPVHHLDLRHLNPEGIAVFGSPDQPKLLIVSDDGSQFENKVPGFADFQSLWYDPARKKR